MNEKITILAIKILDRIKESGRFQKLLSKNSNLIKTRLGLHELNDSSCSRNGLVILELNGSDENCNNFITELQKLRGIIVEVISFN